MEKRADHWKVSTLVSRRLKGGVPQLTSRRRRRTKARRPPQAAIRPGSPAPAMGPGTGANTAMQPAGQKVLAPAALVPASATKTSPLNGSTVIECALEVVGTLTVFTTLPFASTT